MDKSIRIAARLSHRTSPSKREKALKLLNKRLGQNEAYRLLKSFKHDQVLTENK